MLNTSFIVILLVEPEREVVQQADVINESDVSKVAFFDLFNNGPAMHNIIDDTSTYFLKQSLCFEVQDLYDQFIAVDTSAAKRIFVGTFGQANAQWRIQHQVLPPDIISVYKVIRE